MKFLKICSLSYLAIFILFTGMAQAEKQYVACIAKLNSAPPSLNNTIRIQWMRETDSSKVPYSEFFVTPIEQHNDVENMTSSFKASGEYVIKWDKIRNHNSHELVYNSGSVSIKVYAKLFQNNPAPSGKMIINNTDNRPVILDKDGAVVCFKNDHSVGDDNLPLKLIDRQVAYYLGVYSQDNVDKDMQLYKALDNEENLKQCHRKCCRPDNNCSVS